MTKFRRFHFKNDMLAANFLANFAGVFLVNGLLILAEGKPPQNIWTHPLAYWMDALFTPFAFTFVTAATLLKERERMQHSLNLAMEVQQNLLPRARSL